VVRKPAIRREIRLFIASPRDCANERQIIKDLAGELNAVFCSFLQVVLTPIGWEDVAPSLGSPQTVIDTAIGEYDILIGIMWLRFGTPTATGEESGTEHEFNDAYELWQRTGRPLVMFYFNDEPPRSMGDFDISQYQRVRSFKEKLEKVALIKTYKGAIEFQQLLRLDLQRVVRDISIRTVKGHVTSDSIPELKVKAESEILPALFFHSCSMPRTFIKRHEIRRLVETIESKQDSEIAPSLISVVGIAGSGKTISVRAAIDDLRERGTNFNGIFWYSFYEAKAQSSEEFLSEALRYMSKGEVDLSKVPSAHQRKVLLWKYLQAGRYVLILDGLEYLQLYAPSEKAHGQLQDRVMKDFLRGACQLKTSIVIVTSRIYLADLFGYRGYFNMALGSFKREEAWAYMFDSGVKGSTLVIDEACNFFGYHPLSLRVLADYLVRFCDGEAVAARTFKSLPVTSPVAEKLDALFGSYWSRLDEDQQFFLSRLSALRTGATKKDFTVLARPRVMGGRGDPDDPAFRASLARLEDSALLEVHERNGEKFYTAPALLRMLAYDRMSLEERKKAHLEWLRYTEGVPIPSYAENIDRMAPIIEMIYHCLKAGLVTRAWELYNRKGKYHLSRQLIDWGSHEVGIEIAREFWRLRNHMQIPNPDDFVNELIGYYSTHLASSGRIATARKIISEAPVNEFEMPLCIRTRCLLLVGDYENANRLHRRSMTFHQSQYSVEWSEALLQFYSSDSRDCLYHFEKAIEKGFMLVRGYLGLLYFDFVTALIFFRRFGQAMVEIARMEANVIKDGGASGARPYSAFLKAEVWCNRGDVHKAEEQYKQALSSSKETGDTFLESLATLGQARVNFLKHGKEASIEFLDTATELCEKSLTLCREAGEGEIDFGYALPAGKAYATLTRIAHAMGDHASAGNYMKELKSICDNTQNYGLNREYNKLMRR